MFEGKIHIPLAAAGIAAIIVLFYIGSSSGIFFANIQTLDSLALSQDQPLNILFHAFVHSSYSHLIANLCMILFSGIILEPIVGRKHVLAIFAFGAIFAGIGFMIFNSNDAIIGASGGGVALLT